MKRSTRAELARQTVEIVERGHYELADGAAVDIASAVQSCLEATRLFQEDDLRKLKEEMLSQPPAYSATQFEVRNETTLAGIARLIEEQAGPVAVLNFASAKNPGGGFLNGSQAQEESLARGSALHASLMRKFEFYERHRALTSLLYTDAMILSPDCPIFRDDDGALMPKPNLATFISSPAPNAGAIATNAPEESAQIPAVFQRRSELVLALAAFQKCPTLVLGAWGCGVFRNDPNVVAEAFAGHLKGAWSGRFRRVLFAVLHTTDTSDTFLAFQHLFPTHGRSV